MPTPPVTVARNYLDAPADHNSLLLANCGTLHVEVLRRGESSPSMRSDALPLAPAPGRSELSRPKRSTRPGRRRGRWGDYPLAGFGAGNRQPHDTHRKSDGHSSRTVIPAAVGRRCTHSDCRKSGRKEERELSFRRLPSGHSIERTMNKALGKFLEPMLANVRSETTREDFIVSGGNAGWFGRCSSRMTHIRPSMSVARSRLDWQSRTRARILAASSAVMARSLGERLQVLNPNRSPSFYQRAGTLPS